MTLLATSDNPHFVAPRWGWREGVPLIRSEDCVRYILLTLNFLYYWCRCNCWYCRLERCTDRMSLLAVAATRPGYELSHYKRLCRLTLWRSGPILRFRTSNLIKLSVVEFKMVRNLRYPNSRFSYRLHSQTWALWRRHNATPIKWSSQTTTARIDICQ